MILQVRNAQEGQLEGKLELMLAVQSPTWSFGLGLCSQCRLYGAKWCPRGQGELHEPVYRARLGVQQAQLGRLSAKQVFSDRARPEPSDVVVCVSKRSMPFRGATAPQQQHSLLTEPHATKRVHVTALHHMNFRCFFRTSKKHDTLITLEGREHLAGC